MLADAKISAAKNTTDVISNKAGVSVELIKRSRELEYGMRSEKPAPYYC